MFKGNMREVSNFIQGSLQGVPRTYYGASSRLKECFQKGPALGFVGHISLPTLESRITRNH